MKMPASQSLSGILGVLMAAVPTVGSESHGVAVLAMLTLAAVLAGLLTRPAATLAVLLAGSVIVLADPPPILAGLSGVCAAGYLVLRHAGTATAPTAIAAGGFGFAGLLGTAFPVSLPWLPLLAPFLVFACYLLVIQPYLGATPRQPR